MSADDLSNLSREELLALVVRFSPVVTALQERVAALEEENRHLRAQLSGGSGGAPAQREPPSYVKPKRPAKEKKARKQRERPAFRRREEPTQIREHAQETCPDCGRKWSARISRLLSGGWLARSRQVIELPVAPVQIIEHRMLGRHCGVCGKDWIARPDLSLEVVGQSRVGVRLMKVARGFEQVNLVLTFTSRLMSLIALWREEGRLPVRVMQRLLGVQYGLHLSVGELVQVLHRVAQRGPPHYAALRAQIRRAGCVNADETGWREEGENGYLWSFSTPSVCYLERHASRGSAVAKGVLGEKEQAPDAFGGVMCSDFYSGYSWYPGEHQRCWTHLLRNLHALKEQPPLEPSVQAWTEAVKGVYEQAKAWVAVHADAPVSVRRRQRFAYQSRLVALAQPYAGVEGVAQRVLAERALRPSVIARKISGGTRSQKGSQTRCVLRSLFASWKAQGRDVMDTSQQMLTATLIPLPP